MIICNLKKYLNTKFFSYFIDILLVIMILFQDIYKLTLFGTPFYKYIILLVLFLLIAEFLICKKKFNISLFYVFILLMLYMYTFVFSFNKNLIVPATFLVLEILTFLLYFQRFKEKEDFKNSFMNIILFSSIILSSIGLIQYFSYKFQIDFIYKSLTQFIFYLDEGRLTSIYSEPAHLCTILSAGAFVSMYYLINSKEKKYYLFFLLNIITLILSNSIVNYISLFAFVSLFMVFYIFVKKKKSVHEKNRIKTIFIFFIVLFVFNIVLLINNGTMSNMLNKFNSLFNLKYGVADEVVDDIDDNEINLDVEIGSDIEENINNDESSNVNSNIVEQSNSQSGFAIKSNLNIGILKMKDGYFFGSGIFTHINFYDEYMQRLYPDGYIRINYADACSIFLRVFSEFGIIGLICFLYLLIYEFVKGIYKKDIFSLFMLFIFVTQSMRLGEYNWILNCLPFVYIIYNSHFYCKKNICIKK